MGLSLPPFEGSIRERIERAWEEPSKLAAKGKNIDVQIRLIEHILQSAEFDIENGHLSTEYDWRADLQLARMQHERMFVVVELGYSRFREWKGYWRGRAEAAEKFVLSVTQEGMKYTLALHGAAVITCLNALIGKPDQIHRGALVFGAIAGATGIGALILAYGILVHVLAKSPSLKSAIAVKPARAAAA